MLLLAKEVAGLPLSAPETDVASLRAAWLKNREVSSNNCQILENEREREVCCDARVIGFMQVMLGL